MTWTDTPLSTVVLVIVMYNVANCCGAVTQIGLIIVIEYSLMAWTGTTLHIVVLVIEMHYVANCWGGA
jgi:hypothetical protein